MSNAIRVDLTKGQVTIDLVDGNVMYSSEYQKEGTLSVQLRQVISKVSWYPGKKISNEFNGSLFEVQDFGADFDLQPFPSKEERVAWTLVPINIKLADGSLRPITDEDVVNQIAMRNSNGCCIYRMLSSEPIISDDQWFQIRKGEGLTKDSIAEGQAMRYPKGSETEGELILDSVGRVQYRKTFFSEVPKEDIDNRGGVVYLSEALKAELGDEIPA